MNSEYITDKGTIDESGFFTADVFHVLVDGENYMALHTDQFVAQKYDDHFKENVNPETLLSLRLFSKTKELFVNRNDLGKPFTYRLACDEAVPEENFLDEIQFLDIDGKRSKEGEYYPITGNKAYKLPLQNGENAIKIRNYIKYSETGRAEVVDFRIVGFCKKEVR
ncbi:MAG: CRISPR-associated protein Csx19 [Anaerovorax sp.]